MLRLLIFTFVLNSLTFSSLGAQASDSPFMECFSDETESDGALQKLVITQTSKNNFKYELKTQSWSMSQGRMKEAVVAVNQASCTFTKKVRGVGICSEVTVDGYRGANSMRIELALGMNGDEAFRVTHIVEDEAGHTTVNLELLIDRSSCKLPSKSALKKLRR